MGKGKGRPIDGQRSKNRISFIEISGNIKWVNVLPLYKRVAFRLPVNQK